jgi:O-Antigen ligase
MASMNQVARVGQGQTSSRSLFESPAQIVGAALGSAAVVGFLLAHSVQYGVAVLVALLFLPIALLNLPLAIGLFVPLIYLEQVPGAARIPSGVALLIFMAWLGTLAGRGSLFAEVFRRHRGMYLLLLMLMAWITLSLLWARDPGVAAGGLWQWYWAAGIVLVIPTALWTRRHVVVVCVGFVVGGLIAAMITLPQISSGSSTDYATRLGGDLINPNYFAAALLSAAALAAGLMAVVRRPAYKKLLLAAVALAIVAIFATGSRGGLLAGLVMIAAAFALMRRQRLRVGVIVAVGLVLGTLWVSSSDSTLSRLRDFNTSGTGRVDLWTVALRMWEDHPVNGVGFMNFPTVSRDYIMQPGQLSTEFIITEPKETHNAYLGLLAENGVIGLGLFLALAIALIRATWQAARRLDEAGDSSHATLARAIGIAQIGALAALMFTHNTYNNALWILLALGPVLLTIADRTPVIEPPSARESRELIEA